MAQRLPRIEIGFHVFLHGEEEECGAVREVLNQELLINFENAGDFQVDFEAIDDVVEQKVFLNPARLDQGLLEKIGHAHDQEDFPPSDLLRNPRT